MTHATTMRLTDAGLSSTAFSTVMPLASLNEETRERAGPERMPRETPGRMRGTIANHPGTRARSDCRDEELADTNPVPVIRERPAMQGGKSSVVPG